MVKKRRGTSFMEKYLLLVIIISVEAIFLLLQKKSRTFELRDKGIEICYWKLSYRRRLIRTLWFIPIAVIELVWFYFTFKSGFLTCVIGILCGGELIIQLVYNYRHWKNGDGG